MIPPTDHIDRNNTQASSEVEYDSAGAFSERRYDKHMNPLRDVGMQSKHID